MSNTVRLPAVDSRSGRISYGCRRTSIIYISCNSCGCDGRDVISRWRVTQSTLTEQTEW